MRILGKRLNESGFSMANGLIGLFLGSTVLALIAAQSVRKESGVQRIRNAETDIATIGNLSGQGMEYYLATGNVPTITGLVNAGYIPKTAQGLCLTCNNGNGTITNPDGVVLSATNPSVNGNDFGIAVDIPANQLPVQNMYRNALPNSLPPTTSTLVSGGKEIAYNLPVPGSLAGEYVQLNPSGGSNQFVSGPLLLGSGSQYINGSPCSTIGTIVSNSQTGDILTCKPNQYGAMQYATASGGYPAGWVKVNSYNLYQGTSSLGSGSSDPAVIAGPYGCNFNPVSNVGPSNGYCWNVPAPTATTCPSVNGVNPVPKIDLTVPNFANLTACGGCYNAGAVNAQAYWTGSGWVVAGQDISQGSQSDGDFLIRAAVYCSYLG
jgi:hypothetical protein